MRKFLLGALLLVASTISFGRFEDQFGYKIVEKHQEKGIVLMDENSDCVLMVLKHSGFRVTNKEFYDFIDKMMNGKAYKIHHSGDKYVLTATKEHYPVLFINNGKSVIYIDIPNEKQLKKAYQYLKMNEILTNGANLAISEVLVKLSLDELNKLKRLLIFM